MKQIAITLCLSLFLICFGVQKCALAQDNMAFNDQTDIIGTILEVEGLATLTGTNGKPVAATVNMPVRPQDLITTGPRARVFVQLIDNTEFTLGENGQMTVEDYAFNNQDTTNNHAVYSMIKGAFLYVSGLVAKKDDPAVTVKIPYGSIGIRGTKFWGGDIEGEYGIIVGEGVIVVDTDGGMATLGKGQGTSIRKKGAAPTRPTRWAPDKIAAATKQIALKNPTVIGKRMQENIKTNEILRERHRIIVNKRLENIKKQNDVIKTEDTTSKKKEDVSERLKNQRLLDLRKKNEFNASNETSTKVAKPALSSVLNNATAVKSTARNVVRATPLRPVVDAAKTQTTDVRNTVVKPTVETAKTIVKPVVETTKTVVKTTVETVAKPVAPVVNKVETKVVPKVVPKIIPNVLKNLRDK